MSSEASKLDAIAEKSLYTTFSNTMTIEYCYEVYRRYMVPGTVLELGPAEGLMTRYLAADGRDLTLVDGSSVFCSQLQQRFPQAEVVHALFEDFKPEAQYDNILLGHVLEHVEDPVQILRLVKSWLKPQGVVLAAVPNSRSLHRQASVIMGIQPTEDTMSELDYHHGHRRIYNPESFRSDFTKAGLKVEHFGGYWLKPLANSQIHASWTPDMLYAFMKLGERYPDIAGEIYVVAR